MQKRPQIFRK